MIPKIVVYFFDHLGASYRTFKSIDEARNVVCDKNNWPLIIDLVFEPKLASEVCDGLRSAPPIALASASIVYSCLPDGCKFLENKFLLICDRKVFPIINFFGENLVQNNLLDDVSLLTADGVNDSFQTLIDEDVLSIKLSDFEFSVRTTNVFDDQNLTKIGDLVNFSERDFLRFPNFGRKSLREVAEFLDGYNLQLKGNEGRLSYTGKILSAAASAERASSRLASDREQVSNSPNSPEINKKTPDNIVSNFNEALSALDERLREVVKLRIEGRTLEEIGQTYQVTRERIRQLEGKAVKMIRHPSRGWNPNNFWANMIAEILEKASFPISVPHIQSLETTLGTGSADLATFEYILETVFEPRFYLIRFDNKTYVARAHQQVLDAAVKSIAQFVKSSEGVALSDIESHSRSLVPSEIREFTNSIISEVLRFCIFNTVGGKKVLSFYAARNSAVNVAKEIMTNSDRPLSNNEIKIKIKELYPEMDLRTVLNRMRDIENVFPLRHGVWATVSHLGFDENEMRALKGDVQRSVDKIKKDQFHAKEILAFLKEKNSPFVNRLDGFSVAGLIREFCIVNYLGRSMFSKRQTTHKRVQLNDLVIESLRSSGRPLHTKEIRFEVEKVRAFEGVFQVQAKEPVRSIGKSYFALSHWDIRETEDGFFYRAGADEREKFLEVVGGRIAWTPSMHQNLKELYKSGKTYKEMAETLGVTENSVSNQLSKLSRKKLLETTDGEESAIVDARSFASDHPFISDALRKKIKKLDQAGFSRDVIARLERVDIDDVERALSYQWTSEEIRRLIKLKDDGYRQETMARILNIPEDVISEKLNEIRV